MGALRTNPAGDKKLHRRVASEQHLEKGKGFQARGGECFVRSPRSTAGGQKRKGADNELGEVGWNHSVEGEGPELP